MLVEQAQICLSATRATSLIPRLAYSAISHCLQLLALRIVSAVVKVLELTRMSVSSTFRPRLECYYLRQLYRNRLDQHWPKI